MTLDPPDAVASRLIRALEKGADSSYPAGWERLFVLVQRIYPRLIDRAIARRKQPQETPLPKPAGW
jgi:hypothetical protein